MSDINNEIGKYDEIKISDIKVWKENPRLYIGKIDFENLSLGAKYNEKETILHLLKYESNFSDEEKSNNYEKFLELCKSLILDGFNQTEDNIFVKEATEKGKFIVLEGNRRVSAIKFLKNYDEWKKEIFQIFGDEFKKKLENLYDSWDLSKKLILTSDDFSIYTWNVISKDQRKIWTAIKSRNNLNKLGKSSWTRINYFIHLRNDIQDLQSLGLIQENEIIEELQKLWQKDDIKGDVYKSIWVISVLFKSGFYKTNEELFKLKVSALELSMSKIKDPFTDNSFAKIFKIKIDFSAWNFFIENKSEPEYICSAIDEDSLSKFLVENYFITRKYDTRGWNINYNSDLISFLYPKILTDSEETTWRGYTPKLLKEKINDETFIQENYDDIVFIQNIVDVYNTLVQNFSTFRQRLLSIKIKLYGAIKKYSNNNDDTYSSFVLFYSIVDALLHENITENELNCNTINNFPFSRFAIVARSFYEKIFLMLLVNPISRKNFIEKNFFQSPKVANVFKDNEGTRYNFDLENIPNTFKEQLFNGRLYDKLDLVQYSKWARKHILANANAEILSGSIKMVLENFAENNFISIVDTKVNKFTIFTKTWNAEKGENNPFVINPIIEINDTMFFSDNFYSWLCTLSHWDLYDLRSFGKVSNSTLSKHFTTVKEYNLAIVNFFILLDEIILNYAEK